MVELKVEDTWFVSDDVGGGVTRITEPHLGGLVSANFWWVRGSTRDVVVDTGMGIASLREHIPDLFGHNPLAVITHTHLDHVAGAHEFDEIAVHVLEAETLACPAPSSLHPATLFRHLGINGDGGDDSLPDSLLLALPHESYDPAAYTVEPAIATSLLADGDVIDLGDRRLEVLHLPGHSTGSIVLLDVETRTLFSGDVVYEGGLLDEIHGANIADYVRSMSRLRDLDVMTVHPGHGDSFDGERMRQLADEYVACRT